MSQWRKLWELNLNFLSQCRKIYEMSNIFDSHWQIFESWITNFFHSVGKILRWKTIFSHSAENFESWITIFSHSVANVLMWTTNLSHSAGNFESWISIFSHNVEKIMKWETFLTHIDKLLRANYKFLPQRRKSSEVKNIFVSKCRNFWELNFNFVSECRKKIWGEIQICVMLLKTSNSHCHFCLILPKVLKVDLEVCPTTSKKLWKE